MATREQTVKEIVSEFLGFLKYKVDHDALTMEDVKSLAGLIMNGLNVRGTVDDFAGFYGKSAHNVRHVINRHVAEQPLRRVTYTFSKFSKEVPQSWRGPTQDTEKEPDTKT